MGKTRFYGLCVLVCLSAAALGAAAAYIYYPTPSRMSGTANQSSASAGMSWSSTPVSAPDTTLTLGGGASLPAGTSVFTHSNFAGDFKLNRFQFAYLDSIIDSALILTISENRWEFSSNGATTRILSPAATTYNYNRTTSNTADMADQWSTGMNWNVTPVSAPDTTLRIGNGAVLGSGVTVFTNNDIAGDFKLNQLTLSYHWSLTGLFPQVTISGNRLEFVSNGATTPVLGYEGGTGVVYTISNDLLLTNNLSVIGFSQRTTLSGVISGGGSLTKQGSGDLVLTGVNTYTGGTIVDGNTLSTTNIGNAGAPGLGTGGITITDNGILRYIGTGETTNKVLNYGGSTMRIEAGNLGPITFTADMTATTAGDKTLILGGANGEIASHIFDFGAGNKTSVTVHSWALSGANTYTGKTTINGTLSVASINSVVGGAASSNLGAPTTVADGTIDFVSSGTTVATLRYTGAGETTDRVINLAGASAGGWIEQAGSGLLKFTSNLTATGAGPGVSSSKDLVLDGSTTGTGEIAGVIVDHNASHTTGLVKGGTGTWTLSGANTYTGATTIHGGTLLINGDQTAATGAVTVNNSGTLGGTGVIGGAVTVNGGTISPGPGVGTLTLNSNATFVGANICTDCDGVDRLASPAAPNAIFLATYLVDISGATSDKLVIGGVLDLTDSLDQILFNGTPDGSTTYVLATYSSVSGMFDFGSAPSGYQFNYGTNQLELVPVPEPSTFAVAALAAAAMVFLSRRSRRAR